MCIYLYVVKFVLLTCMGCIFVCCFALFQFIATYFDGGISFTISLTTYIHVHTYIHTYIHIHTCVIFNKCIQTELL